MRPASRAFCDGLCREGFTALAPDLFDGRVADTVADAQALADNVTDAEARLTTAGLYLRDNWHPRLGVVGFSLGAWLGTRHAAAIGAEAVVAYYGIGDLDPDRWEMPLLGHFAVDDEWERLDEVGVVFDALSDAGAEVDLRVYEDAGHWFANEDVPEAFDPDVAARAWAATVDFLAYHLA